MTWANFHFVAAFATVFLAYGGVRTVARKQHIIGAHFLFWSYIASWAARKVTGSIAPVEFYAPLDVLLLVGFGYLMVTRRAVWACACVFFHFLMAVCHFRYELGAVVRFDYLTQTGALYFLSILSLCTAIIIGRFSWGEAVDRFLPRPWGYTWSGTVFPRNPDNHGKVA